MAEDDSSSSEDGEAAASAAPAVSLTLKEVALQALGRYSAGAELCGEQCPADGDQAAGGLPSMGAVLRKVYTDSVTHLFGAEGGPGSEARAVFDSAWHVSDRGAGSRALRRSGAGFESTVESMQHSVTAA